MTSILDNFLPSKNNKQGRRKPGLVEKTFFPKSKKKGDLFARLKPGGNPPKKSTGQGQKFFGNKIINQAQWNLIVKVYGQTMAEQMKKSHGWIIQ